MFGEFPLFIFTLLAGGAAGAYMIAAFFPQKQVEEKKNAIFPLVCLILLGVSGLCLLTHLGRPERVLNAFSNITAGITQEGLSIIAFGVVVVIDLVYGYFKGVTLRPTKIIGGIIGLIASGTMANTYIQMIGEPACTTMAVIPLFIIGNIAVGAALYALFMDEPYKNKAFMWASVVIEALLALTLIAMALHFAAVGLNAIGMIVGFVVAPVASIIVMLMSQKNAELLVKNGKNWLVIAICALVVVGVFIARFVFYATL